MIRITFNLDDPESTRQVEQISDEAESLDVYCMILLENFGKWVKTSGAQKELIQKRKNRLKAASKP